MTGKETSFVLCRNQGFSVGCKVSALGKSSEAEIHSGLLQKVSPLFHAGSRGGAGGDKAYFLNLKVTSFKETH